MSDVRRISLLDSLDDPWIKLPLVPMRDVGPAVQTLGGLLAITSTKTFVPNKEIAERVRMPLATTCRQLVRLHDRGWIVNAGRNRTRTGILRRTSTIKIPKRTRDQLEPYGILPWWSCSKLPWCARAMVSVVLARLCRLKSVVETHEETDLDRDELVGTIEEYYGEDRFRFSLNWLESHTGLSRPSIISAKQHLHSLGIVSWSRWRRGDVLYPNWDFAAVITPRTNGRCSVEFDNGKSQATRG